jgi:hypothetical protein
MNSKNLNSSLNKLLMSSMKISKIDVMAISLMRELILITMKNVRTKLRVDLMPRNSKAKGDREVF